MHDVTSVKIITSSSKGIENSSHNLTLQILFIKNKLDLNDPSEINRRQRFHRRK